MIRWIPYSFVRIVLFFIGGILLDIVASGVVPIAVATTCLAVLVLAYVAGFMVFRRWRPFFNLGVIGLPAIFLAGYVHASLHRESSRPGHLTTVTRPILYYKAVISRFTEEKAHSWKVEARVLDAYAGTWENKQGTTILYFSKADFAHPYRYGDVLLIRGSPRSVPPPSNPGEFDYKRYLGFRNIYHQHFLRAGEVMFLKNDPPSRVMQYAIDARTWADVTLRKFVQGERERAIAAALVLGVADGLDDDLLNAYAATGALHVLAVSGLHITIVYMILAWLLRPLLRLKSGLWFLALISLVVLWGYAFITGLSPSVLRAVTMFSFLALARAANQGTNIYNTLAASAFCLLMFDPFLVMSVGFQLSYFAVLGIVYLHPKLYALWEPEHCIADAIWKITSVSIAAQAATFSLGLLYFHQFPNYFLLANLLVIPGSFAVLIIGMVVLAASFIPVLGSLLGWLLTVLIKLINGVIFTLEALPFSRVENIHITTTGYWLLTGFAGALLLLAQRKRFAYSVAAVTFMALFAVVQWHHFAANVSVRKFTVYNIPGHSAIDLVDRGHAYFLTDTVLRSDASGIRFHIHPNRLQSGVSKVMNESHDFVRNFPGGRILHWNGVTILHVTTKDYRLPDYLRPDWIVIGNNAVETIAQLNVYGTKATIILDSSNSYFYCQRLVDLAKSEALDVHSVRHHGAFDTLL